MKKFVTIYFVLSNLLFFTSCNSIKESNLNKNIDPNFARINGTVISIDNFLESTGPCSVNPCRATIVINNVVGAGFGFNSTLIKNDTIKIKFEYTLSESSKELFPSLENTFSGLNVGDSFIGDIERIESILLGNNTDKYKYRIFNYDKIK